MNVPALRHRTLYIVRRLGLPGWLGMALLAAALAGLLLVALPAAGHLARLDAQIAADQEKLSNCTAGGAALSPAQRLASFYGEFPTSERVPDELARLFKLAETHKLELDVGEYSFVRAQGGRLDQFRIALPIKGSYPDIRAFAAEVLAAVPALSLESLALRREKVADTVVDGRIVFLLFVEHGT
ncbi:MAG: hypothetical protein HZA64_13885 [Rhodocyclales bacterium]|nr:hypothetical protein [Rhodocyclales bacterium]